MSTAIDTTTFDDKTLAIARVYSDALLELAVAADAEKTVAAELAELTAAVRAREDFAAFLASPLVDAGDRKEALERMFRGKLSDLTVDTLQVMSRKGRLGLLPALNRVFSEALNRRRGRVEVQVTTALPLEEAQRAKIRQAVAAALGQQPVLEESVDPGLIGGVVFRIGDRKIDGSVASHLNTLSDALLTRGSRENVETYVQREGSES